MSMKSKISMPLSETDIKALVLNRLRGCVKQHTRMLIANEYVVGKTSTRADLVVWGERLIAIEVKSELDSLRRLSNQIASYTKYFDDVLLVVAIKHLSEVRNLHIPGTEIWSVCREGQIQVISKYPSLLPQKGIALADLMTQAERRRLTTALLKGTETDDSQCVSSNDLQTRSCFKKAFTERHADTSRQFWDTVKRRKIVANDLGLLSRYRKEREAVRQWHEQQAGRWEEWIQNGFLPNQQPNHQSIQSSSVS
jgi:hypothetical protein